MKNGFRQSMAWLHTWVGLVLGWVLYFMFLTGTAGYFDTEIDRWMRPERPIATTAPTFEDSVALGLQRLRTVAPNAEQWFINPPVTREYPDLRIFYREQPLPDGTRGQFANELLDRHGQPVQYRDTGGGQVLYQMHYELHYLPEKFTVWLIGACTMFMFLAMLTGIIVHKKIFKDFFTFRPGKQQRSWLDAHNVLSVVALPFHLMITYSGLIFFMVTWMPLIITASYGRGEQNQQRFFDDIAGIRTDVDPAGVAAPLADVGPMLAEARQRWGAHDVRFVDIRHPGDAHSRVVIGRHAGSPVRNSERLIFDGVSGRLLETVPAVGSTPKAVRDVFLGLHEGLFADALLRWLYFFSGLLGTAMIATGLVLWTVKRRTQQLKQHALSLGLQAVERLNIGVIVGLPIGIAVYFWANRLLPVVMENRAAWEVHSMFIAWGVMLLHAHLRPQRRAWMEQLWIAAAACGFIPLLNFLTTERHLGYTIAQGDWVLAGFDLTLLTFGITFALTAIQVRARFKADVAAIGRRRELESVDEGSLREGVGGII